tara:strand:+ start:181 stop:864 length:684 start_codon:yes stop_codon:yes gene_type:complete
MDFTNKIKNTLETTGEADYILILISFFFSILTSFILMYVYRRKSNSLSSKIQLSLIIPLICNITFLVILIVKSSLALSLGLVGALSVIRFRTPVKEPEDLAYLFFAIALGIGYGAMQIYITSMVFIVMIIIIWVFLSQKEKSITNDYNLIIDTDNSKTNKYFNEIMEQIKNYSTEAKLIKIEKDSTNIYNYYRVTFDKIDNIESLTNTLNSKFKDAKFSLYENKIID